MSDHRPRSPDRKFALIAPIAIGVAAVIVLVLVLTRPGPVAAPPLEPPPPLVPAPAAPAPPATASRADLIAAAAAAADAYAAGSTLSAKALVGRRFVVRLAFGCGGPVADPGPAQAYYQYDPAGPALRLVARPATWTDLPLVRAASGQATAETVEGFWIPRPWLTGETCPRRRDVAPPATPTPVEAPSLGLAMFHDAGASRVERRSERPYEHVVKLDGGDADQQRSFDLRLEGRIASFADGAAIHCWSESAEHRPTCLFAVDLDRVAFEDAKGTMLADWPR
ncbi:hypothetical protein [Caulobacter sp. Root1455]|uniref:hypothetical protein n=1 Tax=Caulobacter sp. Root1455 TaxID=1736465 RepID=UPI000AA21968|nr:hypothetical protein [Caulobacter sp. Root1455]